MRLPTFETQQLLITALERYAPKRQPKNISGGCADCGSTGRNNHLPHCKWRQARLAIERATIEGMRQ